MAIFEIPTPRSVSRDNTGAHSRTRTFRSTDPTTEPPLNSVALPALGSAHPVYPAIKLSRYQADPVGILDGWTITCEYSSLSTHGSTTPRPDPNEVGTWRWHESSMEVTIKCPVAKLVTSQLPDATGSIVAVQHYSLEETLVPSNASELTIEVVAWSPSLSDRMAIRNRIGQIHKIGGDPQAYKYKGCDTQSLGLGMRGDDYSAQVVRYIHKWDGDGGSEPATSSDGWWNIYTGGPLPTVIMPNDGASPLFRPPHHVWAMASSASGNASAFPEFVVVRTAKDDASVYGEWRGLPGMEYVNP